MEPIHSGEQLRALLTQPWPTAVAEGLFHRAPEVSCHLAAQTLGAVMRLHCGPRALVWRDGQVRLEAAAVAEARLRAAVWADAEGRPFFSGERAELLAALPAGVLDRLLLALDQVSGYLPAEAAATDAGELAERYADCGQWVAGLLPMAPEAALYVAGYDFAALARAEAAAMLALPGGGEARVDVLAWPTLVAASLRSGPGRQAAPLVDEALARELPYGLCRAVVELADTLSEMGGPAVAVRFLEQRTQPQPDRALPLAAATDGPLPE